MSEDTTLTPGGEESYTFDPSSFKIEMPRKYGGEKNYSPGGLNIHTWLAEWNTYFDVKAVPDDWKIKLIPLRLQGIAITWYNSLSVQDKPRTWEGFRGLLLERWEDRNLVQKKLLELMHMKQKRGTSILAYNERFLNTCTILTDAGMMPRATVLLIYIDSLLPRTKLQLNQATPKNIHDAMGLAEQQDAIFRSMADRSRQDSPIVKRTTYQKSVIMRESSEEGAEHLRTMNKEDLREEDKRLRRCFKCHRPGHSQRDCRSKKRTDRQPRDRHAYQPQEAQSGAVRRPHPHRPTQP